MNLIRAKSIGKGWDLKLGELARIWKGGCIISAVFFDRIEKAYDRNPDLPNLLVDPEFAKEIIDRQFSGRRVVCLAINPGISTPGTFLFSELDTSHGLVYIQWRKVSII
ncbi:6-phosphogluconate dehydrogenase, decarboxylating 2 [Sesamum alatum]|uniref:phosphogluconate dehydrogenase (NADP(+)-dependent, decarboxylating) n=1 Tax=Sesamum alatum TaxID=300844 RepID=A0AAE1Y4X8_9LAMI|nr:6-phosphogluconate dehydrogenase, decarboxylating 2 [Sesamum alatum]